MVFFFGSDNIYKGLSSFTVEMIELRNILKRSNKYSLILGDEICNGTESTSGIAIVASAIDNLLSKSSSFILATHLHELTKINLLKDYFEMSDEELLACNDLIIKIKNEILSKDKTVKAFNIGTNAGKISGQSIMHCHIHLIPRREGDVVNPQGGVRSVIPKKQHYKREN